MNKNGLFSMQGSVMLGVDVSAAYSIIDLIRAKKAAAGVITDLTFDFDGNGVVDANDVETVKQILLGG